MFVYIAHAEGDQAAADDLKAFLKSRGLVVETETGARGFHHLQPSDVVVALWSDKQVFTNYRMVVERRMLDAWADGRLVLAKLDHSFLPVGLRDLPAIDASFANNRELGVWPQVERAVREAMNRALAEQQKTAEQAADRLATGSGVPASPAARERAAPKSKSRPASYYGGGGGSARGSPGVAPSAGAGLGVLLGPLFLLVAGFAAIEAYNFLFPATGWQPDQLLKIAIIVGLAIGGLIFLVFLWSMLKWLFALPEKMLRRSALKRASEAAAPAGAAAPPPAAVFISYSHADDAAVAPVVRLVESTGHSVWIDKTGIHTGDGWAGEIVRAIRAAGGIVVMCSKHAFESDHIKREVYLADRYKKPMVPVFLEEARPPEDFEYFFASVQGLELFKSPQTEWPAAIGKALKAM